MWRFRFHRHIHASSIQHLVTHPNIYPNIRQVSVASPALDLCSQSLRSCSCWMSFLVEIFGCLYNINILSMFFCAPFYQLQSVSGFLLYTNIPRLDPHRWLFLWDPDPPCHDLPNILRLTARPAKLKAHQFRRTAVSWGSSNYYGKPHQDQNKLTNAIAHNTVIHFSILQYDNMYVI